MYEKNNWTFNSKVVKVFAIQLIRQIGNVY